MIFTIAKITNPGKSLLFLILYYRYSKPVILNEKEGNFMKGSIFFVLLGVFTSISYGMIKEDEKHSDPKDITVFFGESRHTIPFEHAMQSVTLHNQYLDTTPLELYAAAYSEPVIKKVLSLMKSLHTYKELKGKRLLDTLEEEVNLDMSWNFSKWLQGTVYKETVELLKAVDYLDMESGIALIICKLIAKLGGIKKIKKFIKANAECTNLQYEFARYYRLLKGDYLPNVDQEKYSFSLREYQEYNPHLLYDTIYDGMHVARLCKLQLHDAQGFSNIPNVRDFNFVLLENNHLTSLTNIFVGDTTTFDRICRFSAASNRIAEIKGSDFNRITNLTILTLTHNKIKRLEPMIFSSLKDLYTLHLTNNDIDFIHNQTFKGLDKLHFLHLDRNKIASFDPITFTGTPTLCSLKLSENNLAEFLPGMVQHLTILKNLYLGGNKISAQNQNIIIKTLAPRGITVDFI